MYGTSSFYLIFIEYEVGAEVWDWTVLEVVVFDLEDPFGRMG